jgi:hypothetical protein
MTEELREQRINYRLTQAQETLQEAEALVALSLFRGVVNRTY